MLTTKQQAPKQKKQHNTRTTAPPTKTKQGADGRRDGLKPNALPVEENNAPITAYPSIRTQ